MNALVRQLVPLFALLMAASLPVAGGFQGQQADSQPSQQIPPVTFKVEINYVEVDAVVVDRNGEFDRSLTKDDFQVLEDGVPQTVSAFGLVDIPVERPEAPLFVRRPVEPDVQTNARGLDGRIYMIVLDDLHTDALRSTWARRAASEFVTRNLGANDLAAVVCTSGRSNCAQDFTNNQRLLLSAIDNFMGNKLRNFERFQRGYYARSALDTLSHTADFVSGVRGRRKALIFISEGIDYDIADPFNNESATDVMDATRNAIASATRANVSMYTVDPRGLPTQGDEAIEGPALSADPSLAVGSEGLHHELLVAQDSLRVLAEETGGFASLNSNDFRGAFDRIRQENSTYYVLGYYPANDRRDGRFRRIDVRVSRPDLTVRARRGYAAPHSKTPPAPVLDIKQRASAVAKEALSSPVPIGGLRFAVSAAPFKAAAPGASVLVVVEADGRDLRFAEKDGRFLESLELCTLAIDRQGKTEGGNRQIATLSLKPDTRATVVRAGVRLTDRFAVRPGRYLLRVAAVDAAQGVVGSVNYDLEVPDFRAKAISMSGIVLTSSRAEETPSANLDQEIRGVLPGPPTTRRVFDANEELALAAEVYDTQVATPHKVDITTTVQSDDGRVLSSVTEERSSTELGGKSGGYGYAHKVALKGMAPGLYLLRVEARSRLGTATVDAREVQFRIE